MKYSSSFFFLALLCACGQLAQVEPTEADTTVVVSLPKISDTRERVNKEPVALYEKKVPNDLNDWRFKVAVYETTHRFDFVVKMQFEEITGKDTIHIPNLGIEPTIALKSGSSTYSCVIGFLDKAGNFKPYKEVIAKGDQLKMTTLHYYTTTTVVQ
jgi:hypothetical protein